MTARRGALLLFAILSLSPIATHSQVCIIGAGIAGAATAFFLENSSSFAASPMPIHIFERHGRIGGRMAMVNLSGDTFEAGASIIHSKNHHARKFAEVLGLGVEDSSDDKFFGIWDGQKFVFKTLRPPPEWTSEIARKLYEIANKALVFWRYGLSLLRMDRFVSEECLSRFMHYYDDEEQRPVFETVEEMLKWTKLYPLTQRTLEEELVDAGLSARIISELVTVITRINYGQSASISGLAGAVSLAGSGSKLWHVKGGNWQLAAGLINRTSSVLHFNERIASVTGFGEHYVLLSDQGGEFNCSVTVIATPLDEAGIAISPEISLPPRKFQHTQTTFVRGIINPEYFGCNSVSEVPETVGTLELPDIPFSSISVLKKYAEDDMAYKIFSRAKLDDRLLDAIFSKRKETIRLDWPAYPHYNAPEQFAPIVLDGKHLYYVNTFESAASAIEASAVAAENVARLIVSRIFGKPLVVPEIELVVEEESQHTDL